MTSFILLYSGPPTPPGASHEGWPEWFQGVGERLVEIGSPMADGFVVHSDGTTSDAAASLNGYSIIQAEDRDEAIELVRNHPFLAAGSDYAIQVSTCRRRQQIGRWSSARPQELHTKELVGGGLVAVSRGRRIEAGT
jgi:hypothetical protein